MAPPQTAEKMAWRGFVCHDGSVIAWPTLLAEHRDYHRIFHTTDADFAARWRQWSPGGRPDIDQGAPTAAVVTLDEWLRREQRL